MKTASSSLAKTARGTNGSHKSTDSKLQSFFMDEIKDIYWAEKHLIKTLPKMQKAATFSALQKAFGEHLETTKEHVSRLEEVFELLGQKPAAKKCDAMEGITAEGAEIIDDTEEGSSTRDVGLILAGQKVEHYEISTYGGLIQVAKTLGYKAVAKILALTLQEEKEADELLTNIAVTAVNEEAAAE